jgi:fucose permease
MRIKYNKNLVFIACCAGLAFFGITMLALGPILSQLGEGANALPATLSIGIIIGTAIFGPIVDKFGYKWMLIAGGVLVLLGMQGLANLSNILLLHSSMLMLGMGGGILNGETNVLVTEIYDDKIRGGRLGILNAFYCIGALLWTLLNYFIDDKFTLPLHIISLIMFAFIIFSLIISFPKPKPHITVSVSKMLNLLKYPVLILFALILFFQCGYEGITGNFTVSYLESKGITTNIATLSMTLFMLGMCAGRLLLGVLFKRLSHTLTLYLYLTVALIGVAVLYLSCAVIDFNIPPILLIYTAKTLIGCGAGATFPAVFNFLGTTFKELSGTVFSIAIVIAFCGLYTFNTIIGIIFDKMQFDYFPLTMASAIIMVMILLPIDKQKL